MALFLKSGFRYTCLKDNKTKNCSCCMHTGSESSYEYGNSQPSSYPMLKVIKKATGESVVERFQFENATGVETKCTKCSGLFSECSCRVHKKSHRREKRAEGESVIGDFISEVFDWVVFECIFGFFRLIGRGVGKVFESIFDGI